MKKDISKSMNFQDLMQYRIREILLVASPYDAFILEEDGRLTEQILYEYLGMNLSYAPRVWHAINATQALDMLSHRRYDLVIVMMRIADMDPITFGAKVKELYPKKPVILLAFDQSEIKQLPEDRLQDSINKVFIWSGNANVFPAIIKYIEDRRNLKRDYKIADIRAIIIIEDNPRYYSVILPLIYRIALKHARNLISTSLSDAERLLTFRARPKILLTSTYEEAKKYYKRYRNNILGIISDVRFPYKGVLDPDAGVKFTKYVKILDPDMPIMLQSTNKDQASEAKKVQAQFLYKHSTTLLGDLEEFIVNNFGFGDFIFRSTKGKEVARATDLLSLRKIVSSVSANSLRYHADRNHFSNWLAVRGFFSMASETRPIKVHHYDSLDDLRNVIIEILDRGIKVQHKGKIIQYSETAHDSASNFIRISTGSLGGKARGLAFANIMLGDSKIREKFPMINIRIPKVTVIGTDEFDNFMDENKLWDFALSEKSNKLISKTFLKAAISKTLMETLSKFLSGIKYPLAVRSSSLLEDSQYQPLAGMYATFMLPNIHKKRQYRLNNLCKAIKLIYASTYFQEPKSLIESTLHIQEEEKMGIIIMEMIGKRHGDRFYPSVSGSAQSYNYYPISYMEREEGVAHIALGLGRTIVKGEKALRFSPKYPRIIPQYFSIKSTIDNSQNSFYALNMAQGKSPFRGGEEKNLDSFPLETAEKDGELYWSASVVCDEDNIIRDSLRYSGTRVITFPSLLKWNLCPLPEIISDVLELGEQSMGCSVEIEFALNLYRDKSRKPDFCLLQIRPMVISSLGRVEKLAHLPKASIFCNSSIALGNGIMNGIKNIVLINPKTFDPVNTNKIALEIEEINQQLSGDNSYILIGPGRWGSADPWLGVPVDWNQISKAKVIVELGMENFPIDPSFGSHFFQNITSMRIGYFTINPKNAIDHIDLDWLSQQHLVSSTQYIQWYRLDNSLTVAIDGKTGNGKIIKPMKPTDETMDEQDSTGI